MAPASKAGGSRKGPREFESRTLSVDIRELLVEGRRIWGGPDYDPERIAVALGVVVGDIHRQVRSLQEANSWDPQQVGKELGNLIFSTIRWCDDLGLNPEECILQAQAAQRSYARRLR